MRRRLAQLLLTMALAVFVVAPPAFADGDKPPPPPEQQQCNAGNGNGNEGCDPGNSAPQNRGGDEIGAEPGEEEGGSTPNPGGNNVFAT